jgi:hypothetical protein
MFTTKSFIETTQQTGGATHWFSKEQFKGYIVAAKGHELIISTDEFSKGFTPTIYLQCAYDSGYNLAGAWVNEGMVYLDGVLTCGVVYLDYCLHFDDYESAKQFATDNEQLAFYCIDGGYVIDC